MPAVIADQRSGAAVGESSRSTKATKPMTEAPASSGTRRGRCSLRRISSSSSSALESTRWTGSSTSTVRPGPRVERRGAQGQVHGRDHRCARVSGTRRHRRGHRCRAAPFEIRAPRTPTDRPTPAFEKLNRNGPNDVLRRHVHPTGYLAFHNPRRCSLRSTDDAPTASSRKAPS